MGDTAMPIGVIGDLPKKIEKEIESVKEEIKSVKEEIKSVEEEIKLADEIARLEDDNEEAMKKKTADLDPFLTPGDKDEIKQKKQTLLQQKQTLLQQKQTLHERKLILHERFNLILKKLPDVFPGDALQLSTGGKQGTSCLRYDKQTNEIFAGRASIGLVGRNEKRKYFLKEVAVIENVSGLQESLQCIGGDNLVVIQAAIKKLEFLEKDYLHNAFVSGNLHKFKKWECGEMACQQIIYAPFAFVFMAAVEGLTQRYAADQDVHSSLATEYKTKTSGNYEEGVISMQPDSAATLAQKRDAFGMMEIMPSDGWDADHRIDYDKCVLMTATTAKIVFECCAQINQIDMVEKIELPFIIAQGSLCSLYVMKVDKSGKASVNSVRLREGVNSVNMDCSESPSLNRSTMLVALAVLLNNFRRLWTENLQAAYRMQFKIAVKDCAKKRRIFSKPPSRKKSKSTNDNPSVTSGTGDGGEASAKKAASCGGKFVALKYPFLREICFTDSDVNLTCQEKSPYYFVCHAANSQNETLDIFLKVWHVSEIDVELARKECALLRRAHEGDIPVAGLKSDELIKSNSEDGHEYVVMAMENLQGRSISSLLELVRFSSSLIDSVSRLHSIGLLHCDIKPENVVWDGKTVKLIDFGHAQEVSGARHVRGTVGFEAPEILRNEPNCEETDAFSVGRTILTSIDDLQWDRSSRILRTLEFVGEGLATERKENRWSLNRACEHLKDTTLYDLQALQIGKEEANVFPFEESRQLATRERHHERSPPDKLPRVTRNVGISLSAVES